jgi:hypothetical protein
VNSSAAAVPREHVFERDAAYRVRNEANPQLRDVALVAQAFRLLPGARSGRKSVKMLAFVVQVWPQLARRHTCGSAE